jgi:hypothetical protein
MSVPRVRVKACSRTLPRTQQAWPSGNERMALRVLHSAYISAPVHVGNQMFCKCACMREPPRSGIRIWSVRYSVNSSVARADDLL